MKKTIFLFFISILSINAFSQESSNEKKLYTYCELVDSRGILQNLIEIDFGKTERFWMEKESSLRDEKDKLVKFRSVSDALNFMQSLDWEFIQAYTTIKNEFNINHWIFKKEITKVEQQEINKLITDK